MRAAGGVPLLQVDDLAISFGRQPGGVRVVDGVSFQVAAGETLGLVGESGSGKTVTAMASIRLLPSPPSQRESGRLALAAPGSPDASAGQPIDLTTLTSRQLRQLWGRYIGVVFQDPMTSLNPTFTVGDQLHEALALHLPLPRAEAQARVLRMLDRVGINAPLRRLTQYPHELSGGLRQRVLIAMALICEPQLLIADEPTTALDVTLQAQILELLRSLRDELGMGVLLITHDLGVVAEFCDRVAVMYAGRIVEQAPVRALFAQPRHPYTHGLLGSIPRLTTPRGARLPAIKGMVPQPAERPSGCAFAPRCDHASDLCEHEKPNLQDLDPAQTNPSARASAHRYACFHPIGVAASHIETDHDMGVT